MEKGKFSMKIRVCSANREGQTQHGDQGLGCRKGGVDSAKRPRSGAQLEKENLEGRWVGWQYKSWAHCPKFKDNSIQHPPTLETEVRKNSPATTLSERRTKKTTGPNTMAHEWVRTLTAAGPMWSSWRQA
jgi:hypothetical protein